MSTTNKFLSSSLLPLFHRRTGNDQHCRWVYRKYRNPLLVPGCEQQLQKHCYCYGVVTTTTTATTKFYNSCSKPLQRLPSYILHVPTVSQQQYQRRTLTSTSSSSSNNSIGLFSVPELQKPDDFHTLTKDAINGSNRLRNEVAVLMDCMEQQNPNNLAIPDGNSTILADVKILLRMLDGISQYVCNIIDAAELCRNVHTSEPWRDAAAQCYMKLSDYISQLNSDLTLYNASILALTIIEANRKDNSNNNSPINISDEEIRFATLLKAEFERDGIHLRKNDPSGRSTEQVQRIQNTLVQLESTFHNNIIHASKQFTIADMNRITDVIPKHVLEQFPSVSINNYSNTIQLNNNDTTILQALLKYSPNTALRHEIYMEFMTSVEENKIVLDAIRQNRNEMATLQGYSNYVDRSVRDKMTQNINNVQLFLQSIQQSNKASYNNDMNTLRQLKQSIEGSSTIEPWDLTYYTNIYKSYQQQQYLGETQYDGIDIQSAVSEFFPLHNTIHALQTLVHKLFGIKMIDTSSTMSPLEQWDIDTSSSSMASKIQKYVFVTDDDQTIGTMYLDLYPRYGKFNHAAHFTVRCGCVQNTNPTEGSASTDEVYQHPIIALVCNFSSPPPSGDGGGHHDDTVVLLSHNEVETLFHEFGHAIHSMLSRTKFQHMSGTRGAMDFVETPSNFMENFVWDTTFLRTVLAKHYITGETMSDQLIMALQQSRYSLQAIERQNQILYSMFDQAIFMGPPNISSTQDIWNTLHQQLVVPYAPNTHWYTRFGHLISYGASYYGYLYSHVFAKKIWDQHFNASNKTTTNNKNDYPLNRTAGDLLWKKVLIHGGAKDPNLMLSDLLKS